MNTPRSAAIYARISSDPTGQALGVQRQLEDCRKLAADRGWNVGAEYVDNDVSAYSGKKRPEYARMMADIRDGLRDAVVVYNMDRLTRRPVELEEFVATCETAGVRQVATVTADVDLGNDDGLFMARIFAAFAAKESGRKSERLRRKARQNAELGQPGGGANRPFGYEADKITVNPVEAEIIREIAGRYIAGESARSIATELEEREIPTSSGAAWRSTTVRGILRAPRIAGLRSHHGVAVATAVWEPIITLEQHQQILTVSATKQAAGRRAPRTYLLSGMLRCGKCQGRLFSSARGTERRYVCMSGADHRGCGGVTVTAPPVEAWLTAAVLYRLDTPDMQAVLTDQRAEDAQHGELAGQRDKLQARMKELSEMFAAGEISRMEWKAARDPLEHQITATEQQLARISGSSTLEQIVGQGAALRDAWAGMNLERQHAIVRAVLDYATIMPATRLGRFDPDRIIPEWVL
jgi:site-specific DNA recombinase